MTKKNWALLIIFLVLTGTFALLLSPRGAASSLEVSEDLFAVADTAAIQRIELQQQAGAGQLQVLDRHASGWRLNQEYPADPRLMRLLLNVLQDVEVKRPVARRQQQEIREDLLRQGTRVRVYEAQGLHQDFYAGGVEERQLSYFLKDDQSFIMEVPGYINYISGIFRLTENNLRNKTIFDANHYNLRAVALEYPQAQEQNLQISFDGQRLHVDDVVRPDSVKLLEFLDLFNGLQVVGYVNQQEFPELDSLLKAPPQALITVSTIQQPDGQQLQLYPTVLEERFRLGLLPGEQQAVLLDERMARQLLLERRQLEKGTGQAGE